MTLPMTQLCYVYVRVLGVVHIVRTQPWGEGGSLKCMHTHSKKPNFECRGEGGFKKGQKTACALNLWPLPKNKNF